jgi:hypothetical protein
MLRLRRGAWAMSFATSGEAALKILKTRPFDVIVSDMRMPNMDGATLPTHVHVANILAHEIEDSRLEGPHFTHADLDHDYLETLGVTEQWPAWRAIAAEIAGQRNMSWT